MDRSASTPDISTADLTWAAPATLGPVVLHKRRRLLEPAAPEAAAGDQTAGPDTAPRGPRVFTLKPTSAPPEATATPTAPEPPNSRPRRKRDAAHRPGEVTRIVFSPEPAEQPAPAPAPAAALPDEASAFARVNAELDALLGDVKRSAYFAHLKFF